MLLSCIKGSAAVTSASIEFYGPEADSVVALIDPMPLRRALIGHFLGSEAKIHAVAAADVETLRALDLGSGAGGAADRLSAVIVALGGEDLSVSGAARSLVSETLNAFPFAPLVIVSDLETRASILAALELGAKGYIPTSMTEEVVLATIAMVRAGGEYAPTHVLVGGPPDDGGAGGAASDHRRAEPTAATRLTKIDKNEPRGALAREPKPDVGDVFSPRECEVLDYIHLGYQNKQIAYELDLSESTVKVHVRSILKKLGATNRTQAAFRAQEIFGFDTPNDPTATLTPLRQANGKRYNECVARAVIRQSDLNPDVDDRPPRQNRGETEFERRRLGA